MAVNSINFIMLITISFIVYWSVPNRYRAYILLGISYIICASYDWTSFLWLLAVTAVSYTFGRLLQENKRKKFVLAIGLALSIGSLLFIKYAAFILKPLNMLLRLDAGRELVTRLIAPVGISFYMFQVISYLADVYKGKAGAEKNYIRYSLYLAFFPKLLAGPIERCENFLPQLDREILFEEKRAIAGIRQVVWGYYKKLVIADTLARGVDAVYNNVHSFQGGY